MASLTSGGLEIQSSIPSYSAESQNITLNKFQFCKLIPGDPDNPRSFNLSGMNLFVYYRESGINYWNGSYWSSIGIVLGSGGSFKSSDVESFIVAMRIY